MQVLPLYPIFKDKQIHSYLYDTLTMLSQSASSIATKSGHSMDTKHRVLLLLLRIQLCCQVRELVESLNELKTLINMEEQMGEALDTLLGDDSAAIQMLSLTLLVPHTDV